MRTVLRWPPALFARLEISHAGLIALTQSRLLSTPIVVGAHIDERCSGTQQRGYAVAVLALDRDFLKKVGRIIWAGAWVTWGSVLFLVGRQKVRPLDSD